MSPAFSPVKAEWVAGAGMAVNSAPVTVYSLLWASMAEENLEKHRE